MMLPIQPLFPSIMHATPLTTPPLAPKTRQALLELGIADTAELQRITPATAFLLLKAGGLTITESTLWQLVLLAEGREGYLNEAEQAKWRAKLRAHRPVARFPPREESERWMRQALQLAVQALAAGEERTGLMEKLRIHTETLETFRGRVMVKLRNHELNGWQTSSLLNDINYARRIGRGILEILTQREMNQTEDAPL